VLSVSSPANCIDLLVDLYTLLNMPHALFVDRVKLTLSMENSSTVDQHTAPDFDVVDE
jgi:hypothetical protein